MLGNIKRMIKKQLITFGIHGEPDFVYSKAIADNEYIAGRWDYLSGLPELERYSVIVGYCQFLFPEGEYLDIGCGEGVLQQRLSILPYKRYCGVDLSKVAIKKAREHNNQRTSFLAIDAKDYVDDHKYNIIIFNECLYYFSDPIKILNKYKQLLSPDGVFIISMYKDEVADLYWKIINRHTTVVTHVQVIKSEEISWTLKVITL